MKILPIFFSLIMAFSLLGCKASDEAATNDGSLPTPTPTPIATYFPIEIRSPGTDVTVMVGTDFTYTIGGGKPPYIFTKISGPAEIGEASGVFRSGDVAGNTIIKIADASGLSTQVIVRVNSLLTISPQIVYMYVSGTNNFIVTGGVPGYTYEILSGSGFISSIGSFLAPPTPGTTTLRVNDIQLNSVRAQVETNFYPTISPTSVTVSRGASLEFVGGFGFPPYLYTVTDSSGAVTGNLGTIEATTGKFTAPQIERSMKVVLTDKTGMRAESVVSVVNLPLTLNQFDVTLEVNKLFAFKASGGLPPYSYSLVYGDGLLLPNGTYYAPDIPTDALIEVTDAENHIVTATIKVNSPLTLSPNVRTTVPNRAEIFTASGGVPPYNFYIVSGSGDINNNQDNTVGSFIAPNTTGRTIIKVVDQVNTMATATIDINPDIQISPMAPLISVGNSVTFIGSGGIPPYEFDLLAGPGIMNVLGKYTANEEDVSEPVEAIVRVRDSRGTTKTATVRINPKLKFLDSELIVKTTAQKTILATGGVPPYRIRFAKDGSLFGSTVSNANGIMVYQAGVISEDHKEVLQITDSLSNKVNKDVSILSGLVAYYDPSRSRVLFSRPLAANSLAITQNASLGVITNIGHSLSSPTSILLKNASACYNYESYDLNGRYPISRIDNDRFSINLNQKASATGTCSEPMVYDIFGTHSGEKCPSTHVVNLLNLKSYQSNSEIILSCSQTNADIFSGNCSSTTNCANPYSVQVSRGKLIDPINRDLTFNVPLSTTENSAVTVEMWFKWNADRSPEAQASFNGTLLGFDNYNVSFMTVNSSGGYTTKALCFNTSIAAMDCYGMRDPDPLTANRWANYTFVFNNGDVTKSKIFINGVSQSLSNLSISVPDPRLVSSSFKVGVNYNNAGPETTSPYRLKGEVGIMRVYDKELNTNEILNNYQEFKPIYFQ